MHHRTPMLPGTGPTYVFSLFEYLTESIAITDSMFNCDNFFTKKAVDLTEIERTKKLVSTKFCCASNANIQNVKKK